MSYRWRLWVSFLIGSCAALPQSLPPLEAPYYAASSIVNAASPKMPVLAPNTIATVYGERLSRLSKALAASDIRQGAMPISLPSAGVKVTIGGQAAGLFYVSPGQINFLVPPNLPAGTHILRTSLDSWYGPGVPVKVAAASPALFQADPERAIAARAEDWTVITRENPASPGSYLVLWATGLGQASLQVTDPLIATQAVPLARLSEFRVLLNGIEVPPQDVWAGLAVGFCGLYQINFKVPDDVGPDPEIRIGYPDALSPDGVRLSVR